MTTDHDPRWDELALGHVLGGLDEADSSAFRRHLVDCPVCRSRVGELRGLASELAVAEREERAVARIRMATPRRDDVDESTGDEAPGARWPVVAVLAAVTLVIALLVGWAASSRATNGELARVNDLQERVLDVLGRGSIVPVDAAALGVTGAVAVDGDRVAFTIGGLPTLDAGERMVVWVHDTSGVRPAAHYTPTQLMAGRLASVLLVPRATRLVVSIEDATIPAEPTGAVVVDVRLP